MTNVRSRRGFQPQAWLWISLPFLSMLAGCASADDGKVVPQIVDARRDSGRRSIIAADGKTVAVAYAGPLEAPDSGIYLAHSNDGGASFDPAKPVLVDAAHGIPKDLTVAGGSIYVTYQVVGDGGSYDIRVASSDDGGETFAIQSVANGLGPALLVSGTTLYLAYNPQGQPEFGAPLFQRSDDRGQTWSPAAVISATATPGPISVNGLLDRTLSLGESGGNLYLSFFDGSSKTQKLAHSSDSGETWTVEAGQNLLATGSLVAVGDDVVLPMVDAQNRSFTCQSHDHGATWTAHPFDVAGGAYGNYPVDDILDTDVAGPHLVGAGSRLYAIFNQPSIKDHPIAVGFARSDDQGATWPAASVATVFASDSWFTANPTEGAQIVVSSAPVPALLTTTFDGTHLRVLRSTDDGASWR